MRCPTGALPMHAPRWIAMLSVVVCVALRGVRSQYEFPDQSPQQPVSIAYPHVTDVSAMCSAEGITAQIMFDGAFPGKIYSANYGTVHECIYYNLVDMNMILFSIPNHRCGTKLTRNTRNVVDYIENEVYVQMDKDTQTNADRRYLFICELAGGGNGIAIGGGVGGGGEYSGTINPSQSVIVQTIEPTRIVATQTQTDTPDVVMEIQEGDGPFAAVVARPLKLGETITLVVKSQGGSSSTGVDQYNMFVHSCFAADGTGATRVQLIDRSGCTVRPQVAGRMQRTKTDTGGILYFFRLSAFKFPGPNDVYFSCSVDICPDCNFANICPANGNLRLRRSVNTSQEADEDVRMQLYDNVKIDVEPLDYHTQKSRQAAAAGDTTHCFTGTALFGMTASIACLLMTLITLTVYITFVTMKRRKSVTSFDSDPRTISQVWTSVAR